jgi:MoaA/NifB/PqqE/SkfB family radical SAM enzyme
MVKVSGVPYEVKMELMELTDERILELARECGASKVFVAGFSIAGNAKIIDFARRIVEEVSKG